MHYDVIGACILTCVWRTTLRQLTIRGVGDQLHDALKAEAERRDLSINRYVLSVLRHAVGLASDEPRGDAEYHDLDDLAGTWTQQEYEAFSAELTRQRAVDPELWQ
jgi:hypothetical protein